MLPLIVLIAVGVYAILAVVVWIALHLSRQRTHDIIVPLGKHPDNHLGGPWVGYFAVWEWREARWLWTSGNHPDGIDIGPPPGYPGAFEGETIKTWVRPR